MAAGILAWVGGIATVGSHKERPTNSKMTYHFLSGALTPPKGEQQ